MKCPNCGYEHAENFCPKCGAKMSSFDANRQSSNQDYQYENDSKVNSQPKGRKGLGRAAHIVSIVGLALCWTLFYGLAASIAAYVMAGKALPDPLAANARAKGKLGIILSSTVGAVAFIVFMILYTLWFLPVIIYS